MLTWRKFNHRNMPMQSNNLPMEKELAAIQKQRERWITAINSGSATGFVAILTEDAVWLPAMQDALSGKEKICAWLEKPFAELDYDYSVSDVHLHIAGDWAVEQARFSTKAQAKSDGEVMPIHEGLYTLLWRKTSTGTWLIDRYIDHSVIQGQE